MRFQELAVRIDVHTHTQVSVQICYPRLAPARSSHGGYKRAESTYLGNMLGTRGLDLFAKIDAPPNVKVPPASVDPEPTAGKQVVAALWRGPSQQVACFVAVEEAAWLEAVVLRFDGLKVRDGMELDGYEPAREEIDLVAKG